MTDIEVLTHAVTIEPHPNADRLECARIGGYIAVVPKGQLKTGDIAAYIPEQSVIPDELLEIMGLTGKLSGSKHNRVKAVKLRGVLSQGLVLPMPEQPLNLNVAKLLGIVKYEPPLPTGFAGDIMAAPGPAFHYEIHNIKRNPELFLPDEEVVMTEKIHGTWCAIGQLHGQPYVASKGLAARNICFKVEEDLNTKNVYVQLYRSNLAALDTLSEYLQSENFLLLGEIYGKRIQDLDYGLNIREFRVFDIYVYDDHNTGHYLDYNMFVNATSSVFTRVPILYRGPFNEEKMLEWTDGHSILGGNIREGIVIKPAIERETEYGERVIAKSISEQYLLRKNATEYN